jgi:hypothetical protein
MHRDVRICISPWPLFPGRYGGPRCAVLTGGRSFLQLQGLGRIAMRYVQWELRAKAREAGP